MAKVTPMSGELLAQLAENVIESPTILQFTWAVYNDDGELVALTVDQGYALEVCVLLNQLEAEGEGEGYDPSDGIEADDGG